MDEPDLASFKKHLDKVGDYNVVSAIFAFLALFTIFALALCLAFANFVVTIIVAVILILFFAIHRIAEKRSETELNAVINILKENIAKLDQKFATAPVEEEEEESV